MVTCIVIELVGSEKRSIGARAFETLPRIGEWIAIDEDDVGIMFSVKMIAHASDYREGFETNGADIYVTRIGSELEALQLLRR